MPTTPAHTSGTSSSGTQAPSRTAIFGLVDRPPPTQRSKPGPCSGCSTPTNEMSLTSCATSCCQEIAVLNLRGRFDADERDVVDLVRDVLLPGDRGLELAR